MQVRMFMSVDRVAESLDISPTTVKRLIDRGQLNGVRVGRQIRVSVEDLLRYVNSSRIETA